MKFGIPLAALVFSALSVPLQAGVITGRVVDSLGNGVAGVNIDANGGATVVNGGTDANGFFTTTITPDGNYDLIFEPPPPPASTSLTKELENVNVFGTVNLGNVVLAPGVALTGRVVRAVGGLPVPAVNLDVEQGGTPLLVKGDVTDASGNFSIAVPASPITVFFKTDSAPLPLLAPHFIELFPTAATNLGDVQLQPGFVVTAIVRRASNNTAVVGADLDVHDSLTGAKLYTPGDNSDGAGFVDFVVPAGTYDVEVCPPFADLLVGKTLLAQVVTANKFLGTVLLDAGVVLSGKVLDFQGQPHAGVDVDMKVSSSGAKVTLCADNTDAAGNYQVVVPTGTFDVKFTPPPQLGLGTQTIPGVVVSGNTVLNGTLPGCVVIYCTSKPSSIPGCTPSIQAPCQASLSGGAGSADVTCGPVPGGPQPGLIVYTTNGPAAVPAQNPFGFLCITAGPGLFRVLPPGLPGGAVGTCSGAYVLDFGAYLAGPNPDPNLVSGASIDMQVWYRDPPNPAAANFSNAARFTLIP
jgi:hypothetical protein